MSSQTDFLFWKNILDLVEAMDQMNDKQQMTKKDLLEFLEGLQHRLQDRNDPLENFDAFVVHKLCRVLVSSVESVSN